MSDVKFCVNCKHHEQAPNVDGNMTDYCRATRYSDMYLVDGTAGMPRNTWCAYERKGYDPYNDCGPEGRFFEPKQQETT